MSVPNIEAFNKYKGNGLSTEFSVSFPYNSKNHIKVYLKRKDALFQETLEENLDYEFINDATIKFPCTLTREVEKDGQTIIEEYTNQDVLQEGDILAIYRETPLESNYNFKNQVRLFPSEVTDSDDLSILLIQELYAMIQRALIMDQTSDVTPIELVEQVYEYVEDSRMYSESAAASAEEAANLVPYIDNYIENTIKPMMDSYSVQILEQTLENSTKPSIDNYIENKVKPDIYEYAQTEGIQPIEQATTEAIEKIREEGGLGRYAVGDIGINPFIDESKNLRKYLNGQTISQEQFKDFANLLKKTAENSPSLFCTEDEWQAIKSSSKLGQVGKFVIDDTAGTIRLPRIVKLQGLLDLSNIGSIVDDGLPTHTHTRGDMNITGALGNFASPNTNDTSIGQNGAFNTYTTGIASTSYYGNDFPPYTMQASFDASKSWTGNTSTGNYSSDLATTNTVQEEAIQYPYFIQVANGVVEEIDVSTEIQLNNPFDLFDIKWSIGEIENLSWVKSDGNWVDGTIYTSAYNRLIEEYTNGTEQTSDSITYRKTPRKYRIADISQDTLITSLFDDTGIANYFVLDSTNQRFKLPRTKWGFVGDRGDIGSYIPESLPNITGTVTSIATQIGDIGTSVGVFVQADEGVGSGHYGNDWTHHWKTIGFDASLSSSTYQNNAPVQQRATQANLYFYVGETVQDANLINAANIVNEIYRIKENVIEKDGRNLSTTVGQGGVRAVIESYRNDTSWYRIYSDGWCEQGGIQTSATVTLLKNYRDTNYTVIRNLANVSSDSTSVKVSFVARVFAVTNKTINSFNGSVETNYGLTSYMWQACGYIE